MATKQRYHLHVCLVRNESYDLENALQQGLSDSFFLTWDLIGSSTEFMDYSRKQMDRCDYLLFVLGNGYGSLSVSGVSYLHLSYIYAATKRKPMIAMIKTHSTTLSFSRQRLDLATLIQREQGERVIPFYHVPKAIAQLSDALQALIVKQPQHGWSRSGYATIAHEATLSANVATALPANLDHEKSDLAFTAPLKKSLFQPTVVANINTGQQKATASAPAPSFDLSSVGQDSGILLHYSAHAYQDGNLQNIMATHTFKWKDIIDVMRGLPTPFSIEMMQNCLNDLLKPAALAAARQAHPNVHAVARCQINGDDFLALKKQLIDNQWLLPANDHYRGRKLWQINPMIVQQSLAKHDRR